jgi:dihydropteroate synthase
MMAKDTFLNRKLTLNSKGRSIELTEPSVMAILNLTPDSFYAKSRIPDIETALLKTADFLTAGAKFIDLGAYSSRPGAVDISVAEELDRFIPVIEAIVKAHPTALISVDTFRATVAEAAINAGAHLINDISGGMLDERMFDTVAKLQVPYIMMHMKGTPQNMQEQATYNNVVTEVFNFLEAQISRLHILGVNDIVVDPGFGFAKTLNQNYELLNQLEEFTKLQLPILVGFSRKSMVSKVLESNAADALNGTSVLNTAALMKGASILRVHDVKEAVECIKLVQKMKNPAL